VDESVRGGGWLFFAGIMVFIAAVLTCIWGVAAIDNAHFFIEDKKFIISDLNTWGWIILIAGIIQLIAAFSIWAGGGVRPLDRAHRRQPERDRGPAVDTRLSLRVPMHLRGGCPDHLGARRLRWPPGSPAHQLTSRAR
jgi:hypothetical protein